ncbi:MAG: DinB family protein [Acidobacteria bacterium]|nr:DinB family protein [Acidobacteriota bacterium]
MKTLFTTALISTALLVPAFAQQAPQAPPTTSAFLRNMYNGNKNNITRSADKVPEDLYGLRPGPQEEVRTFGQHLAHVANYNFLWCSQAKGEKNPNAGINFEATLKAKADILKVLADSFAHCDPVYAGLNDENGAQVVEIQQESGRVVRNTRMALLMLNVVHNNEIYGNLITTMRIKSIVPPSSEPRPAR